MFCSKGSAAAAGSMVLQTITGKAFIDGDDATTDAIHNAHTKRSRNPEASRFHLSWTNLFSFH